MTPYLSVGENVLYAYQYDFGSASGISYTASFQTIPEPASIVLVGLLMAGVLLSRRW